jgi:pimeloyl-ACP methyl ester carboxylesterase
MIPPGSPHGFSNVSDQPAVLLNTFTPDLYVQYFRDLRDLIARSGPPTPADATAVMSRYATTPAPSFPDPHFSWRHSVSTYILSTPDVADVEVTVTERGEGRPVLLLHGGGGPMTVAALADLLASRLGLRVITPVHPGFGGTPRPEGLNSVPRLAALYAALLDELGLSDVIVAGNSLGGWIAAESALVGSSRITGVILINGVGIEVPGHPAPDFFSLTPDEVAKLSWHDPDKFRFDPSTLPPAAQAAIPGNMASLATYSGPTMSDPSLTGRLAGVTVPVLVVWGEADQMFDVEFGRAYAAAIPGSRFQLISEAGHLPQIEAPEKVLAAVGDFI